LANSFDVFLSYATRDDGKLLATGSKDTTARLWEVATGKEIIALRRHEKAVTSVAFSPDGKHLATGSDDHTARLWDVATGQPLTVLRGHEKAVTSVAFSPDGKLLATGSDDHTVRLWEVEKKDWPIETDITNSRFRGQELVDFACARVHDFPLSEQDKERFGITQEWCTPGVSAALRAKLGMDAPPAARPPSAAEH
jgi:WD40 repeat protein